MRRYAGNFRLGVQLASKESILWHHSPGSSAVGDRVGGNGGCGGSVLNIPWLPVMDKFAGQPEGG